MLGGTGAAPGLLTKGPGTRGGSGGPWGSWAPWPQVAGRLPRECGSALTARGAWRVCQGLLTGPICCAHVLPRGWAGPGSRPGPVLGGGQEAPSLDV